MTRLLAVILSTILALQSIPSTVYAQTAGSGATNQSSSNNSEELIRAADRAKRIENFHTLLLQGQKKEQQYRERLSTYLRKRADNRRTCRDDLRRSNRDTKMTTLLRCYRAELTLQKEFLLQQKDYLTDAPGITTDVRKIALGRLDLLLDAINTVVFAIDNGVYQKEADVMEARKNLLERYRLPAWSALTIVRADRMLSWIAYILQHVSDVRNGEMTSKWDDVITCLTGRETDLLALLQGTQSPESTLTTIEQGIGMCLDAVKAVPRSGSGSGV